MKVCFFDFTTMVGGATKGSIYLLQRLEERGGDVSVIDVYGNCDEYIKDIKDASIRFKVLKPQKNNVVIGNAHNKFKRLLVTLKQSPNFIAILINLFLQIKKENPDFILVNNEKSLFFLALCKKILNFKIILYYRGEANQTQMNSRFIGLINSYVDIKYCHSKKAIKNLMKWGVVGDIHYLPNCVNSEALLKYKYTKPEKNVIRILLNAGRVVEEKGFHTAIEALGILNSKGYKAHLILPGLLVDQEYKERLNGLIYKYNIREFVDFIGWVDNITELLASVDCMILPSYTEGFPRSIIESMLLKIPVCATPVGGIPEAIYHQQTGYIFEVNDSNGLATSLQSIIDCPLETQEIIQCAYDFAIKNFDEEINTQLFLDNLE